MAKTFAVLHSDSVALAHATGYTAWSARHGNWRPLTTTQTFNWQWPITSSTILVSDGLTLHVFDARLNRWAVTQGAGPLTVSISRHTAMAIQGTTGFGFGQPNGEWDTIALANPGEQLDVASSIGTIKDSSELNVYSVQGSLPYTSRFPEFTRATGTLSVTLLQGNIPQDEKFESTHQAAALEWHVAALGAVKSLDDVRWIAWGHDLAQIPEARWLSAHVTAPPVLRTSAFSAQLNAAASGLGAVRLYNRQASGAYSEAWKLGMPECSTRGYPNFGINIVRVADKATLAKPLLVGQDARWHRRVDLRGQAQPKRPLGEDAQLGAGWAQRSKPTLLVLVVGETARAANWGLNGYARDTTPQLTQLARRGELIRAIHDELEDLEA